MNLSPVTPATRTLIPVPLYRDTDDDLLEEPHGRRATFAPRRALRDPMTSPAFRVRFGTSLGAEQRGTRHEAAA